MKESTDDVLLSVKESTATVGSASVDVIATETAKIDEGDDVDVVESRVVSVEKGEECVKGSLEVVKEVVKENVVSTVVIESDCDDQKLGNGPVVGDCKVDSEPLSKEVIEENVVTGLAIGLDCDDDQKSGNGPVVGDSKMDCEPLSKEVIQENMVSTVVNESDCRDQKPGNGPVVGDSEMASEPLSNVVTGIASGMDCDDQKSGNGPVVGDSKMDSEPLSKEVIQDNVVSTAAIGLDCDDQKSGNGQVVGGSKMDYEPLSKVVIQENVVSNLEIGLDCDDQKSGNGPVVGGSKMASEPLINVVTGVAIGMDCDNQKSGNRPVVGDSKVDSEPLRKEVIEENVLTGLAIGLDCDDQKAGNGLVVEDCKMDFEPLSKELESGGDIEVSEYVEVVVDGDHVVEEKAQKESEVISFSKIPESTEGDVAAVEVCLVSKDKGEEDGVNNQSSLTKVVDRGSGEDNVHAGTINTENEDVIDQTNEESFQSTNGGKKSVNGDFKMAVETQDSTKIPVSEDFKMDDENAAEVDQMSEEESASKYEASKMDDERQVIEEEIDVKDKKEDLERGLTNETVEQPTESAQEVADGDHVMGEVTVKDDDALISSKISHSLTMASLGLEDVDVVVVDEGLEGKNEAQDNQSLSTEVVNVGTVEVDSTSKDDNSYAICSKGYEVTAAHTEPNSHVQVVIDGGILVENQSMEVDPATNVGDSSNFEEEQGLAANASNEGNEITLSHVDSSHGVLPANFSYEEAHMDRGEDAGMDIDEVLGWKDEIPSMQEDEEKVDPTNVSNAEEQETESFQQSRYFHPPEREGEFSVSDLVWGQFMNHPWWPGQIFDPSDASETAMKCHKKDCFLVAYFGDRTFGWNDSTVLKPFREYFSQIARDINSEAFKKAVHCALVEVSRRVELGLTCSCIPHDIYENIRCQIVENSGIKQESSRIHCLDQSASVSSFEPGKLVDYVRLLATVPCGESDRMELTMAKAQLSSYGRFKGYCQLAEFQLCGDLLEAEQVIKDETYSEDGSKKRKAPHDSYWTDRIIQNHPEEQLLQENPNGGGEHQIMAFEQEKPLVKPARRSNKKRYFSSNHEIEASEQSEILVRRQQNLATEVMMKFADGIYFPSEIHLNKMFRRFGPLMESETEVDRQSGRARVVFKKCSDAEIAHSSAGKFNIFGSISVNYELNYTPLISYKPLPLPVTQHPPHAC